MKPSGYGNGVYSKNGYRKNFEHFELTGPSKELCFDPKQMAKLQQERKKADSKKA